MLTASRARPSKCLYCNEFISTNEWAHKLRRGKGAHLHCYRIKKLFDAGNKWINDNFVRGE